MLRSQPLKRRTRIRAASKRAIQDKDLDALCRKLVFLRDGHRCVYSGSTRNLQWAHVESRRYKSTRWNPLFSMTFSAGTHLWWHHRPVEAIEWWRKTYPERALALQLLRSQKQKVDRPLIKLYLEAELAKLERKETVSV